MISIRKYAIFDDLFNVQPNGLFFDQYNYICGDKVVFFLRIITLTRRGDLILQIQIELIIQISNASIPPLN